MSVALSPQEFVDKWRKATLKERSASQQHFLDLCALVGHAPPAEDDPTGERFTFEAGAAKTSGGEGWADVWKKGAFAWEYKGKHKDLEAAYRQLLQYHEALGQPPLLVVSDMEQIVVRKVRQHTQAGGAPHAGRPAHARRPAPQRAGVRNLGRQHPGPRGTMGAKGVIYNAAQVQETSLPKLQEIEPIYSDQM